MQLGVSNISWEGKDNSKMFKMLKDLGFDYIESVFLKILDGFPVKAVQSILYNSGITSLDDTDKCASHINKVIDRCESLGINVITFGSPSIRVGSKNKMKDLLLLVDNMLDGKQVKFCIEPNAKYYGAEYYNTLEEICKDLSTYKNIYSMIDVGNSLLEGKDPIEEYKLYGKYVYHIHFAAKDLKEIENYDIYKDFYRYLIEDKYDGLLTYEFATIDNVENNLSKFIKNIKENIN
jgi:hypothetical protein